MVDNEKKERKSKKVIDEVNLSDFESNMQRLEDIANSLENNNLTLEQAFLQFSEGSEIAAKANKQLTTVTGKISEIVKNNKAIIGKDNASK